MEKYTEESIKREMEGIHETDLQNRLKKLYEEKKKIASKKNETQNNEIVEYLKTLEYNINLSIKVYERNLPLRLVERARRSSGIYETEEELSASVAREEESISER